MLFLHGYLADKNSFAYQIPFFSKYFNVYAFDLTGFGENKQMPYPYKLDDYVEEVKAFIKKNGLKKPSVIAHSFGGRIAIKLAGCDSGVFDKIVLTGSAGLKPKRTIKYRIKRAIFCILKLFIKKEKLIKFYSKDYLSLSPVMKQSFKYIVNEHLDGLLKNIKNPTFIVYGKNDKETPVYMAKRLNKNIPNSKMLIIKQAGHFCFIDKPLKFNTEVREFLLSK